MQQFELTLGLRFLLALALGLLVGLERESTRAEFKQLIFGGVRTFPILSMYGFACAWLYSIGATFMLPAGLISVLVLAAIAYVEKMRTGRFGATSETSALLTFVVGALTLLADIRLAMALGVMNTLLLSEKNNLEGLVERLSKVEFLATVRFLLVTFIILPVLPDQAFTRYNINPAQVWKIVVMVSSVGFVGYFLTKRFGDRVGLWLSGLMGGIVSSTAVSVASGRIAHAEPLRAHGALQATLLASSVMYLRILVLVGALNPALMEIFWWKLAALAALGIAMALLVGVGVKSAPRTSDVATVHNPFEIRTALMFGLLFVGLMVLTVVVRTHFGNTGVLTLAGISGMVDVDPFVLSMARDNVGSSGFILQSLLVAMMSNTLMKGIYFSAQARSVRALSVLLYAFWVCAHLPLILW